MDWIVKLAIAAVSAIAADMVTKEVTGKHIHEHFFEWWGKLRERILAWAHEHQSELALKLIVQVDKLIGGLVRLTATGQSQSSRVHTISEETVSEEEAFEMFPNLRNNRAVDVTAMVMQQ